MLAKLGDLSKRDEFAQYLKNFAQKVASVKFNNDLTKCSVSIRIVKQSYVTIMKNV